MGPFLVKNFPHTSADLRGIISCLTRTSTLGQGEGRMVGGGSRSRTVEGRGSKVECAGAGDPPLPCLLGDIPTIPLLWDPHPHTHTNDTAGQRPSPSTVCSGGMGEKDLPHQ